MDSQNPFESPRPHEVPAPSAERLDLYDILGFFGFPVIIFAMVVLVANTEGQRLAIPTYPFINVDRNTQARVQMVLMIAMAWTAMCLMIYLRHRVKLRGYFKRIVIWNFGIFALALVSSYFRWPVLLN